MHQPFSTYNRLLKFYCQPYKRLCISFENKPKFWWKLAIRWNIWRKGCYELVTRFDKLRKYLSNKAVCWKVCKSFGINWTIACERLHNDFDIYHYSWTTSFNLNARFHLRIANLLIIQKLLSVGLSNRSSLFQGSETIWA